MEAPVGLGGPPGAPPYDGLSHMKSRQVRIAAGIFFPDGQKRITPPFAGVIRPTSAPTALALRRFPPLGA